jgi:hypothetical protein
VCCLKGIYTISAKKNVAVARVSHRLISAKHC